MPYRLDEGGRDNLEASTVNYILCQSWLSKSGKMDKIRDYEYIQAREKKPSSLTNVIGNTVLDDLSEC